jgi:hypothetical protein
MITIADMRTSFLVPLQDGLLKGMRNAKNPARSYLHQANLHQAYLHVRELSDQDRLELYGRWIADAFALRGLSGMLRVRAP